MSLYTVQLDRENSTPPTVRWPVRVWDLVDGGVVNAQAGVNAKACLGGHELFVPELESWIPDTLQLVLYELSAYIPAHDAHDALVTVDARLAKPRGRAPKDGARRRPRFNNEVRLSVSARGWKAEVETWRTAATGEWAGRFTEPMQDFLLELAAQSPFPLASVQPEIAMHSEYSGFKPSRLAVLLGEDAEYDEQKKEYKVETQELIYEIRQHLERRKKADVSKQTGGAQ